MSQLVMYASEAREDFEFECYEGLPWYPPAHWFFLLQSMLAVSHLTDCQHCDVETISYAGQANGKHIWIART